MLQKLEEAPKLLEQNLPVEKHHIIPKSLGGPDAEWNLVVLTHTDHYIAHNPRFKVYSEFIDQLFLRLRTGQTLQAQRDRIKASHKTQKFYQTGFFNKFQQVLRGKKGGKTQTPKKIEKYRTKLSLLIQQALASRMVWTNKYLEYPVVIEPDECSLVLEVMKKLQEHRSFGTCQKSTITSGLARVMKGQRKSYQGWQVEIQK
uniref:Putative HNH homing endonuclease n=1 Tax=Xylochloris irregularis TaxID=480381 RepID=A0A097KMF5_9CHLO|nr:putative HNH homing endonuclease [Xylochloris irregularis]AIT94362.1 putative HNH homing endonuclease [Xylochloris irregularis]